MCNIPKILHFVWVGSEKGTFPLPPYALANVQAWRTAQPDYQVLFWRAMNHSPTELAPEQADAFRLARNAGESSDVIRHNLLYKFGGYSIDLDIAPLRGLSSLHEALGTFAQEKGRAASSVVLTDGSRVLGSEPQGPLVTEMRRRLPSVIAEARRDYPDLRTAFTGWKLIQECVRDGFGAGETLALPGDRFPAKGTETPDAIGVHDFAAEWAKQIA